MMRRQVNREGLLTGFRIPDPERTALRQVVSPRSQARAIWTPGDRQYGIVMSPVSHQLLATAHAPYPDCLVIAGRGQAPAVPTPGQGIDPRSMSLQGDAFPAGVRVPDSHHVVRAW